MLHQTDGLSLQSPIRPLSVLVFYLLLTHSCRGQLQLIGPPQPIVALVGDDIILPCHLKPEMDVTAEPLEWKRSDLIPELVHVMRAGRSLENVKNPSYRGRTSLFADELKRGNISLKLSNVQVSDQGTYRCDIPLWNRQSSLQLVVVPGAVASAVITLSGMDRVRGGVLLDCASRGWYPQPEVLWLDGEGNLLSAGPTETVRGPDHLYTVSSRVTVEKRHSNSFTCRVQQRTTNQTRETHITVPDDFFTVQSSSVPIITGLAVSLAVCILLILFLLFVVWRWRPTTIKNKRSSSDEAPEGQKEIRFKTNGTEDQCVTADGEREQLMTDGPEPVQLVQDNGQKKSRHVRKEEEQQRREEELQRREEEQQRREEAEKEVQTLKEELETKKNEWQMKLHEETTKREEAERQVETLKELNSKVHATTCEEQEHHSHQEDSSSANHSSASGSLLVIGVDQQGKYIHLTNTSNEEQQLGGWRLEMQVNRKNISFTFEKSFSVKSGDTVTVSCMMCPSPDLWWKDFKPFSPADRLKFTLINITGEIRHELRSLTE
ncbi:butyrophilin subfamily 1 member A1-like isoform 2-T2 [Lycodopsis pacificus]